MAGVATVRAAAGLVAVVVIGASSCSCRGRSIAAAVVIGGSNCRCRNQSIAADCSCRNRSIAADWSCRSRSIAAAVVIGDSSCSCRGRSIAAAVVIVMVVVIRLISCFSGSLIVADDAAAPWLIYIFIELTVHISGEDNKSSADDGVLTR